MTKRTLLIFAVLCAAILVGCSKTETTDNTAAGNSNKPTTTATTTTTPATTTTTASTSDGKIGIPECDEFIAKYEACTNKVPEIVRAQYKSASSNSGANHGRNWPPTCNQGNTCGR